MPSFSTTSLTKLQTCQDELIFLFKTVVKVYDCTVIDGFRDENTQNSYFLSKKSKVKWPESKHNVYPSQGVDVGPYIKGGIPWQDKDQFYHFSGFVLGTANMLGIKLRYGGDWDSDNDLKDQNFMDLAHYELVE